MGELTAGRDRGSAGERGLSDADLRAGEGGDAFEAARGTGGSVGRSVVSAARRLLVDGDGWAGGGLGSLLGKFAVSLRINVPRIGVTSDGQGR